MCFARRCDRAEPGDRGEGRSQPSVEGNRLPPHTPLDLGGARKEFPVRVPHRHAAVAQGVPARLASAGGHRADTLRLRRGKAGARAAHALTEAARPAKAALTSSTRPPREPTELLSLLRSAERRRAEPRTLR